MHAAINTTRDVLYGKHKIDELNNNENLLLKIDYSEKGVWLSK